MGFLDRFTKGVNAAADPLVDATVLVDPALRRGARLAANGLAVDGTIVGIDRRTDDTNERTILAVHVPSDDGGSGERFGVQVGSQALTRMRLGLPVAVRTDGGRAVLDLAAMFGAWGVGGGDAIQRSKRSAPADGIRDTALDSRVQRRLKKWTPGTGTIARIEPVTALGMTTDNWDVHVTLADGTASLCKRDVVAPYARWYAVPGAVVPLTVDPGDPSACTIDWPELARNAATAVSFDDVPPPGSVAALTEARWVDRMPVETVAMGSAPPGGVHPGRNVAASNATLAAWISTVQSGRMSPEDFDKAVADWHAAGMCTEEEAAAARAAIA